MTGLGIRQDLFVRCNHLHILMIVEKIPIGPYLVKWIYLISHGVGALGAEAPPPPPDISKIYNHYICIIHVWQRLLNINQILVVINLNSKVEIFSPIIFVPFSPQSEIFFNNRVKNFHAFCT